MKNPAKKLSRLATRYETWLREDSAPLWWKNDCLDNGAFYEALDFKGRPVPASRARVRVQARQIYSFALAWKLGFRKKSLPARLERSIERFLATCLGPEGLPGREVDIEQGVLTDPKPDLYNTAFALMALAQTRKVLKDRAVDERVGQMMNALNRHMAYEEGNGYREFLPENTIRMQNPHMHLFEAFLLLFKITGNPELHDRAEILLNFIRDTFFDEAAGVVQEKVNPQLEMTTGQYEPGHSMEWVWLLGWRSRLFDVPLDPFAVTLYTHYVGAALPEGQTPMALAVDNQPVDPSCRLWSQTESLRAHLAMAERGPAELAAPALERAVNCANVIFDDWLKPAVPGGWLDHFDANGDLIAPDMPASMCFHVWGLVLEMRRSSKKLRKKFS
ncbi:MAG: hypothetical protein HKO85_01000 [Xanthomonadales bacterium]|nr:hypothetical protein [Xanthomonadales bacterium]